MYSFVLVQMMGYLFLMFYQCAAQKIYACSIPRREKAKHETPG